MVRKLSLERLIGQAHTAKKWLDICLWGHTCDYCTLLSATTLTVQPTRSKQKACRPRYWAYLVVGPWYLLLNISLKIFPLKYFPLKISNFTKHFQFSLPQLSLFSSPKAQHPPLRSDVITLSASMVITYHRVSLFLKLPCMFIVVNGSDFLL